MIERASLQDALLITLQYLSFKDIVAVSQVSLVILSARTVFSH